MSLSAHLCHSLHSASFPSFAETSFLSACRCVYFYFPPFVLSIIKNNTYVQSMLAPWLVGPLKKERRGIQKGDSEMMMRCEGLSSVLYFGKCADNEIKVLNQICTAWVIGCCSESSAYLHVETRKGAGLEMLRRKRLRPLPRHDKDCEIRFNAVTWSRTSWLNTTKRNGKRLLRDYWSYSPNKCIQHNHYIDLKSAKYILVEAIWDNSVA